MKNTSKLLRALLLSLALIVCVCMLFACGGDETPDGDQTSSSSGSTSSSDATPCEHKGGTATCTAKAVCSECGEEYGELAAHDYADATCTAPKTCKACEATDGAALGHDEVDAVVAPTCVAAGVTNVTCTRCDYTATKDVVPATGAHVYDVKGETVAPTCTEAGYTVYSCSAGACGTTENKDPVDALGHDEKYDTVAPTCTEAGITNITCSRCDYTSTKDPVDALGHDEQYEVIDPDCLNAGITNITCTRCDYTSTKDPKDALGHTGGTATCTTLAVCERQDCGASYGELAAHTYYTDADAVVDEHYEVTLAATCTEDGTYAYKCTVCGGVSEDEEYIVVIPALGHKSEAGKCRCGIEYGIVGAEGIEKAEASHEGGGSGNLDKLFDGDKTTTGLWNDGNKEYWPSAVGDVITITLKGEVYTDEIAFWICGNWTHANLVLYDAEGNQVATAVVEYSGGDTGGGNSAPYYVRFNSDVKFKSFTLTSADFKWESGRTQKLSEIEIFIKSCPDHAWVDATCVEVKHCALCGLTEGELADHVYNTEDTGVEGVDYEITTAPTCITEGVKTYKCTVCAALATNEDYIVAVEKAEHKYDVAGDITAPTCITKGYTTYGCSAGECGTTENRDETAEIQHAYTEVVEVVAPTCITKGYTTYGCSAGACGTTEDRDETAEIQHAYTEVVEVVDPTCITKGYTTYSCSAGACGTTEDRDETAEIGHAYTVAGDVVDPTCSAEGYTVYGCSAGACGLTENKDFTRRVAHAFVDVNEFDEIVCTVCQQSYRNINTQVSTGDGTLCLGCEGDEEGNCVCNVKVEWNGYIAPEEVFVDADVATAIEELEGFNGGLVRLTSEEETTLTITVNGEEFTVTGTDLIVDLYSFETVESLSVYAAAGAELIIYKAL